MKGSNGLKHLTEELGCAYICCWPQQAGVVGRELPPATQGCEAGPDDSNEPK